MTDQWVSNLEDLRDQRHVVEEFEGEGNNNNNDDEMEKAVEACSRVKSSPHGRRRRLLAWARQTSSLCRIMDDFLTTL